MKTKKFFNLCACVLLLGGLAMLTSCVYDSDEYVSPEEGSLTISIKSDNFDVPLTRVAVDNQTNQTMEIENAITTANTVIAIFDGSGDIIDVEVPTVVDGKLTLSKTETGVDWLADAAEIYVAANLPAAKVTTLAALTTTKADFVTALGLGIADALNSNSLTGTQIPMFGYGTVSNSGGNNYTATVNVDHMLTKVTLNSLGVDFSRSATPNASFQPEQVFLVNVPDNIGITGGTTNAISQVAPDKYYQGEAAGATGDGSNNNVAEYHQVPAYGTTAALYSARGDKFNAADYLGTAALAGQTVMNAENPTWLKTATAGSQARQQYFFYTMPNTTGADAATQTQLVIRGSFKENVAAAAEEVYYRVPLNQAAYTLDANKNYQVDVIIMQKGATDAYAELPNDITASLAITYNVTGFTAAPGTVCIGNGAATPTAGIETTAKVGDYFYNDGTWSSTYDNTKTLVGLVFSTKVSDDDRTAGYTHGYVMALTDAGYNYNGGTPIKQTYAYRNYTPGKTAGDPKEAGLFNIGTNATQYSDNAGYWTAVKADLDGRSHTVTLLADANQAEYLAAHAADDYNTAHAVTGTNSGWYLPSIGQLYDLAYNFGGRTVWPGLTFNHDKNRQGEYNEYHNCYFVNGADATTSAINSYLEARLVTAADLTVDEDYQPFIARVPGTSSAVYWSSSDYSAFDGLHLYFHSSGFLSFGCSSKTSQYYVRPVLAF